jgi:hypothetical protein
MAMKVTSEGFVNKKITNSGKIKNYRSSAFLHAWT